MTFRPATKLRSWLRWPPLASLALLIAGLGTMAAFVATTINPGSSFSAASTDAPPTISRATVKRVTLPAGPGYLGQGSAYYTYAQVDDDSAVSSVTADLSEITLGGSSVTLTTSGGPWTIGGETYNYANVMTGQEADNPLSEGAKNYTITATDDAAQTTGPQGYTATIDNTTPVRHRSVIQNTAGTNPGYVKQGETYYVYAYVTDASSGVSNVQANTNVSGNVITAGASFSNMAAGSWTVGGQEYNYRTSMLTADDPITDGSKTYRITGIDNVNNQGQTSFTVTEDSTGPTITSTIEKTSGSGGAGYLASGQTYYVYANASDSSGADTTSLTAVDTNINSTGSSTPFALTYNAGGYSVGGTTYYYRSASRTAKAGLTSTTYTVSGSDDLGNSSGDVSFNLTADNTGPSIDQVRICGGSGCSANWVAASRTYYVYANVSDAGSDVDTVTANVNSITLGETALALTTCASNCTVGGTTYAYKSIQKTADAGVAAGNFTVTATDNVTNSTTSAATPYSKDTGTPTSVSSRVCGSTACTSSYVGAGKTYRVYANATDSQSGVDTVVASLINITSGASSIPLTSSGGPWTVGGTSYAYRSDQQTADGGLSGTPSYQVTYTDNAGNYTNPSSTVTVDNTAPTVTSVICGTSGGGCTSSYVGYFKQYYVYANVTETGSGTDSLTADLTNIDSNGSGASAVPLTACVSGCTVGGVTYAYTSGARTSNLSIAQNGTYNFSVTANDNAGNAGTQNTSATGKTLGPVASSVTTADGGGTLGRMQQGDSITFTYDRMVDPTALVAGWTGSGTQFVAVRLTDTAGNDSVSIYDSTNTSQLPLGSVATNGNYAGGDRTFGLSTDATKSTIAISGSGPTTVTVTLGTLTSGTVNTASGTPNMTWTPNGSLYDFAANPMSSTAAFTETDSDKDF